MPIGTRARTASLAVAILVTALAVVPAVAVEQAPGGAGDITAFAKPTQKPRPSHPHATPVPTPVPTPQPTPVPTPLVTPRPDPTTATQATPRTTQRPPNDDPTPRASKRPTKGVDASAAPSPTFRDDGGGMEAPSAGTTGQVGPSPEVLGLATTLAAMVGLGFMWIVLRHRRRQPRPTPGPVAARVAAVPPLEERWMTASLDDNDALPVWLRALAEPERAPLAPRDSPPPREPSLAHDLPATDEPYVPFQAQPAEPAPDPARAPVTFLEPIAEGGMRLAIGSDESELLDQPGDAGVALATLRAGDEVEILDIQEPWLRVVTPLGQHGWIRSDALGFGAPPAADPGTADSETAAPDPTDAPSQRRRGLRLPRRPRSAGQAT